MLVTDDKDSPPLDKSLADTEYLMGTGTPSQQSQGGSTSAPNPTTAGEAPPPYQPHTQTNPAPPRTIVPAVPQQNVRLLPAGPHYYGPQRHPETGENFNPEAAAKRRFIRALLISLGIWLIVGLISGGVATSR
jgi:hypothetical protein